MPASHHYVLTAVNLAGVAVAVAAAEAELETIIELMLDQNLQSNLFNIGLKIYLNSIQGCSLYYLIL